MPTREDLKRLNSQWGSDIFEDKAELARPAGFSMPCTSPAQNQRVLISPLFAAVYWICDATAELPLFSHGRVESYCPVRRVLLCVAV